MTDLWKQWSVQICVAVSNPASVEVRAVCRCESACGRKPWQTGTFSFFFFSSAVLWAEALSVLTNLEGAIMTLSLGYSRSACHAVCHRCVLPCTMPCCLPDRSRHRLFCTFLPFSIIVYCLACMPSEAHKIFFMSPGVPRGILLVPVTSIQRVKSNFYWLP